MTFDSIARIRRFNRAVTAQLGALDHSFLGLGRPLGTARVLHAISHYGGELTDLRNRLNLDKAVLSRHLKALQDEDLVALTPDPADARRKRAILTEQGEKEVAAYDALSDKQAAQLLGNSSANADILAAMDLIATALTKDQVEIISVDPQNPDAVHCLQSFYDELAQRLDTGFDVALSNDPQAEQMRPPQGDFLLAMSDGLPLGCVGLKGGADYAEVKRLWIAPSARRMGVSRRLMTALETRAVELGFNALRLDTNSALPEAVALYQATGWTQIERYNDDPYPDLFFEKGL